MNKITTYKEQSEALKNGVHFINKTKRAFDAVVFELTNGTPDCKIIRTLTLKTNGLDRDFDTARCQRLSRRLRALGFKQNWAALGHPQEGLKGTVRMWRTPLQNNNPRSCPALGVSPKTPRNNNERTRN